MCLYDVEDRVLLRRVQISANRSLDGVLDQLNSREMTDANPAQLLDDAASDEDELLPPTTAGVALAVEAYRGGPSVPLLVTASATSIASFAKIAHCVREAQCGCRCLWRKSSNVLGSHPESAPGGAFYNV